MRWAVYGPDDAVPLHAFCEGLGRHSHSYEFFCNVGWSSANSAKVDAAAIYGLRAQGRDILNALRNRGIPVVVLDLGYMSRANTAADFERGYLQVGMNRLGWFPAMTVPHDRFDALGIEVVQGCVSQVKTALICGQVEYDASHDMTGNQLCAVYEEMAAWLTSHGAKVRFRGHPLAKNVRPQIPLDGVKSLQSAIADADLIVTINSNSGLDALIAGKPVMALKSSHYAPLAYPFKTPLPLVKSPDVKRVRDHLAKLAYAQWTASEIRRGDALSFLLETGGLHGQA